MSNTGIIQFDSSLAISQRKEENVGEGLFVFTVVQENRNKKEKSCCVCCYVTSFGHRTLRQICCSRFSCSVIATLTTDT